MKNNIDEIERNVIDTFVKIRKKQGLTQEELSNMAGVIRETIARIETSNTSPKISTMLKLLKPMGYTLKIVRM